MTKTPTNDMSDKNPNTFNVLDIDAATYQSHIELTRNQFLSLVKDHLVSQGQCSEDELVSLTEVLIPVSGAVHTLIGMLVKVHRAVKQGSSTEKSFQYSEVDLIATVEVPVRVLNNLVLRKLEKSGQLKVAQLYWVVTPKQGMASGSAQSGEPPRLVELRCKVVFPGQPKLKFSV